MRIRTLLRLAATGAAGWAVGVSGVEDNPRFAILLGAVACLLFLAAENYGGLKSWRKASSKSFWAVAVVLVVGFGYGGFYLAVHYNAPRSTTVDEVARSQSASAIKDAADVKADLGAKLAALDAQVKSAMQFQEKEKEVREQRDKAEAIERQKREQNRAAVGGVLAAGNRIREAADSLVERPELQARTQQWYKETLEGLTKIDASYAAMFASATGGYYTRNHGGKPLPQANVNLWNNVTHKTEALSRILETMPR
jgi:hypothetical protein